MLTSGNVDENIEKFVAEAAKSLSYGTFVKLVLSNNKGHDPGPQRISVRLIDTKKGLRMMFQSRFDTRDVVKNFLFADGLAEVEARLTSGFRNAHLFTTVEDLQLDIGKRNSHLRAGKGSITTRPSSAHDREKKTLIDPDAFYLKALRIADDKGRVKPSQRDKWRQINKFVEILASLVEASPIRDKQELKIVDMGSGKGYLTFAAYDYFSNVRTGRNVSMTGVDARTELVDLCNDIANAGGFDGLEFMQGQIADLEIGEVDVLIALHACDTATDDALFKGIRANASIIIAAPCCHKELRRQVKPPGVLAPILRHGMMLERTCEMITDGLRSLLLEREGYSTKLFEFVPTEHTPKNNMLVAVRRAPRGRSEAAARQIEELSSQFGILDQRLEKLLGKSQDRD